MDKPIICCFKIKSATLLIGIFDLMCHIMILSSLFASISNPHLDNYSSTDLSVFKVPAEKNSQDSSLLSNVNNNNNANNNLYKIRNLVQLLHSSSINSSPSQNNQQQKPTLSNNGNILINQGQNLQSSQNLINSTNLKKYPGDYLWLNTNTIVNKQDRSIAVLVTTCSSLITMMLIYGVLYNKPSYLMPYFSIKVFQVVITCITTLGFYSTLPNIKDWLKTQSSFLPYKETFLQLDSQTLELFVFAIFLMTILIKLYVVITVWYCYRHMMLIESYRNQTILHLRSATNGGGVNGGGGGCMGRNSISNGEDTNNGFKIDDESLITSGIGSPPKYEEIIKQIKEESLKTARNNNNNNNNNNNHVGMATTSANSSANQSQLINNSEDTIRFSKNSNHINKTVEPPAYSAVVVTQNV